MGLPVDTNEKIKAIAKVFNISRHVAHELLYSNLLPEKEVLNIIAKVLEVNPEWLKGESKKRTK